VSFGQRVDEPGQSVLLTANDTSQVMKIPEDVRAQLLGNERLGKGDAHQASWR